MSSRHRPASRAAFLSILPLVVLSASVRGLPQASNQRERSPTSAVAATSGLEAIERAIFEAVNRERAVRGLQAVKRSEALNALARRQSRDMAKLGLLIHASALGRSYTERLVEAGVFFAANGENVARSNSADPELVHQALMKSDGHRGNILRTDFDEVGVGVVRATDGAYYVTEDFIRRVVFRSGDEARTVLMSGLEKARLNRGRPPLVADGEIQGTAQAMARTRSEGRTTPSIPPRYGESRVLFYVGADLESIASALGEVALDRFNFAGIGVRFARSAEYPGGAYHVCALLAAGIPALRLTEKERIQTVLSALNRIRSGQGKAPLALDEALGREADDLNRRYQQGQTDLRTGDPNVMAVFYGTSELNRLAAELNGHVSEAAFYKVGISVLEDSTGLGTNSGFVVVLLLAR